MSRGERDAIRRGAGKERPLGQEGIYGRDSRGLHEEGREGAKTRVRVRISMRLLREFFMVFLGSALID